MQTYRFDFFLARIETRGFLILGSFYALFSSPPKRP